MGLLNSSAGLVLQKISLLTLLQKLLVQKHTHYFWCTAKMPTHFYYTA